jgi:hypothetical protein
MAFGFAIKKLREDAKISVGKLTGKIGVSAARWRKWEEKDFDPRDEDKRKIEEFFGKKLIEIEKMESIEEFLKVPHHGGVEDDMNESSSAETLNAIARERIAIDREREAVDRERKALQDDKAFLQELLRSSFALALVNLKTIRARQEAAGETVLAALARLEGKPERSLVEAADTRMSQIEEEWSKRDSVAAPGK